MSLHGSHIDLGQLASALANGSGGSTATTNPLFGASYSDETEQWHDPDGKALAPEHQKTLNAVADKEGDPYALTKNPYVTPSWSDRVFHPEVAKQETDYNNAWNLQGPAAQHSQDTTNSVNARQAGLAAKPGTAYADMSDLEKGIATAGRFDTPSILAVQQSGAKIAQGTPESEAIVEALRNTGTKRKLIADLGSGLPEKESTASVSGADALTASNQKSILTDTTAMPYVADATKALYGAGIADNTNAKLMADALRPSIPDRAALTNNQAQREVAAIPTSNKLYGSNLGTELNTSIVNKGLSDVAVENLTGLENERRNLTLDQIRNSYHMPPPSNPLGVSPDGTLSRTPNYANMMQTVDAKLGTGGSTTQNGFSPQLSSGWSIGPDAPTGQTNSPLGSSIASSQLPVATNNTTLKDQWGSNQKGVIAQGIAKSKEIEAVRQQIEEAHVTRNIKALNEATKRLNELLGTTHAHN